METEEQKARDRERGRTWYVNLTPEQKKKRNERSRINYEKSSAETIEKRRLRNSRWHRTHPEYRKAKNRNPRNRFWFARYHAKQKGLDWNISLNDFIEYISKRCAYCDGPLPETGCGLDRMDNLRGYVVGNVVPCCKLCNFIKGAHWTHEEMVASMTAVKQVRLKKAVGGSLGSIFCEHRDGH